MITLPSCNKKEAILLLSVAYIGIPIHIQYASTLTSDLHTLSNARKYSFIQVKKQKDIYV